MAETKKEAALAKPITTSEVEIDAIGTVAKPICGLVMPISSMEGCSEKHWSEVRGVLTDSISKASFDARIVSEADDVGIIHKRIVQNLYQNRIVVCDVSAKNPNVMFELGLRLAFDKPVVIVKDDKTSYSFDTSSIEHLTYPRDLRYSQIVEFSEELTRKITATDTAYQDDNSSVSFLKHFGQFQTVQIDSTEVSTDVALLDEMQEIRSELRRNRMISERDKHRTSRLAPSSSKEMFLEFSHAIKSAAKNIGVRGKNQAKANKEEIYLLASNEFNGPKYFRSSEEERDHFDVIFKSIYS